MRLIETHFLYTLRDKYGNERREKGSYLGRKVASSRTLRRFIRENWRKCAVEFGLVGLEITAGYPSRWIAK